MLSQSKHTLLLPSELRLVKQKLQRGETLRKGELLQPPQPRRRKQGRGATYAPQGNIVDQRWYLRPWHRRVTQATNILTYNAYMLVKLCNLNNCVKKQRREARSPVEKLFRTDGCSHEAVGTRPVKMRLGQLR